MKWIRRLSNGLSTALVAATALLVVTGCGSSPDTQFLALESIEPDRPPAQAPIGRTPLTLGQVTVPPGLDRQRFVRRVDGAQLEVLDTVRWTAPLSIAVRQTLARNLAARLPAEGFIPPDQPAPAEGLRVFVVSIDDLVIGPTGDIALAATWSVIRQRDQQVLSRDSARITASAASPAPADAARALSRALARLADAMVGQLR